MASPCHIFVSYARSDDEPFVKRLFSDLTTIHGHDIWWDRELMESRGRTFLQEIRDAIATAGRLILVVGPAAVTSDYVRVEWEFALAQCKIVIPILRLGDYPLIPKTLQSLHCPDFRDTRPYGEALNELLRILAGPVPALAALHGLDALPEHFLPRLQPLQAAQQILLADVNRPTVITAAGRTTALRGMGGIGKTVLATALGRACATRRAFADGVHCVRLGQHQEDVVGALRLLGQSLGDDLLQIYIDAPSSALRLTRLLTDKRCLLILDDVWVLRHVEPFINALGPRGRLLITTRDGALVTALGAQEIHLDVLSDHEALALLAQWSRQLVDQLPVIARDVAAECGNLPLALAMVGALVQGRPDRWGNALHKLRQADLAHIGAHIPNYEHPSLLRAIQVSVDALADPEVQEQLPNIQHRYLDFAVFHPDTPIPVAALEVLWAPLDLDAYQVQDTIDCLVNRSLARHDEQGRLALHDLQFDYVRICARDLVARHAALLKAYASRCSDGWSSGPDDGYFFQHLAYHFMEARRPDALRALLLDFRWLQAKLAATDVRAVLNDFDYLPSDSELRHVHEAIKRSAQVVQEDHRQFAGQLVGRLISRTEWGFDALLEQAVQWQGALWLRPLSASLVPPGDPLLFTLAGHEGTVRSCAVTPDGRWGITAGNSSPDRTVRLWDLANGIELHTLVNQADQPTYNPVALAPDGRRALVASGGNLHFWNVATGKEEAVLPGHSATITAVAVADEGRRAVSAADDGSLTVWDLVDYPPRVIVSVQPALPPNPVHALAITPDGRHAVTLGLSEIKCWDLEHGRETAKLQWPSGPVDWYSRPPLAIAHDGRNVYFGSPLQVWRVNEKSSRTALARDNAGRVVAVTPDGRVVLTTPDNQTLEVWDVERAMRQSVLPGQGGKLVAVALSSDGRTVLATLDDHYVKVWALEFSAASVATSTPGDGVEITPDEHWAVVSKLEESTVVWDFVTARPLIASAQRDEVVNSVRSISKARSKQKSRAGDFVQRCIARRKGSSLAGNGTKKGLDGRQMQPIVADTNGTFAITYDKQNLKTSEAAEAGPPKERYALRVWNLAAPDAEPVILLGHSSPVNSIVMSPDARRAVSGCIGRTLRLWDLQAGRELQTLRGHRGIIWNVKITPNGDCAVSASEDRTVRVWDLRTGACIAVYTGDLPMRQCAVHDDGRAIAALDVLGRLHLLRLEGG